MQRLCCNHRLPNGNTQTPCFLHRKSQNKQPKEGHSSINLNSAYVCIQNTFALESRRRLAFQKGNQQTKKTKKTCFYEQFGQKLITNSFSIMIYATADVIKHITFLSCVNFFNVVICKRLRTLTHLLVFVLGTRIMNICIRSLIAHAKQV